MVSDKGSEVKGHGSRVTVKGSRVMVSHPGPLTSDLHP